jgi:hypothetical protein
MQTAAHSPIPLHLEILTVKALRGQSVIWDRIANPDRIVGDFASPCPSPIFTAALAEELR